MTRKEIRDLTELLMALEEDSPMPDKRKITQLKIILEKLDNEELKMEIHKWNPETKESLCGKKTESNTAHLHFSNEFLYDPSPDEMKCEKCREIERGKK